MKYIKINKQIETEEASFPIKSSPEACDMPHGIFRIDDEGGARFDEFNDDQDGTYFEEPNIPFDYSENEYDDEQIKIWEKRQRALLYLYKHQELLDQERYKTAYDRIRDFCVRQVEYDMNDRIVSDITEEDRSFLTLALDIESSIKGDEIEFYKDDVEFIVQWLEDGNCFFL